MSARFAVTGADGQLGWELIRSLRLFGDVFPLTRADCDLADPRSLTSALAAIEPTVICNAAAFTAVDRAESEPDLAMRVNADAVGEIGAFAASRGALVMHFSTDYVFDGKSPRAYREDDRTGPLNAYGRSKLAGEVALRESGASALTCRTSWVYSTRGNNFLRTILRLARERDVLRVVADQVGAPTSAEWLASASTQVLHSVLRAPEGAREACRAVGGTLHLAASGETSWHGFAEAILSLDPARHEQMARRTERISQSEYPSAVERPARSTLDCSRAEREFGVVLTPWRDQLQMLLEHT